MDNRTYDALKLENQLCFPLYACSREIIRQYKPFLDELQLTYTQYIVMMVLWERRSVTVKELGDCLYLDSGTLTPLLKKMEAKGLLTRVRSTKDERNLIVTITAAGEALRKQAIRVPALMAQCSPLEPQEAATLYRLLYKLLRQDQAPGE
ncbi:MAG: MarR family transcriptional regulator [Christensenellaceae bacterium]|nr:MarR family transcriptional regulator [Christensenellaceae bacterium]